MKSKHSREIPRSSRWFRFGPRVFTDTIGASLLQRTPFVCIRGKSKNVNHIAMDSFRKQSIIKGIDEHYRFFVSFVLDLQYIKIDAPGICHEEGILTIFQQFSDDADMIATCSSEKSASAYASKLLRAALETKNLQTNSSASVRLKSILNGDFRWTEIQQPNLPADVRCLRVRRRRIET